MDAQPTSSSMMRLALTIGGCMAALVLAALGIKSCMRSDPSQGLTPGATDGTKPGVADGIRLGATAKIGGMEFTPLDIGLHEESGRNVMVLRVRAKNITEGQVFDPLAPLGGWNSVEDNFGNHSRGGPWIAAPGDTLNELKPGQSVTAMCPSEPPKMGTATDFKWSFRLQKSNSVGDWVDVVVLFRASDIQPLEVSTPRRDKHEEKPPEQPGSGPSQPRQPPQEPPKQSPPRPPGVIGPDEAQKHVGEEMTVEYLVAEVGYDSKSDTTWLNCKPHFKGSTDFNAPIFSGDKAAIQAAFGTDLNAALKGKTVRVKGKIETYSDAPRIKLKTPDQLTIIK